jgi:endoglucanase
LTFRLTLTAMLAAGIAFAHASPTPVVQGPLRVRGNALVDANGSEVQLWGVNLPMLDSAKPPEALAFKVIRRRWNLKTVRIPVSVEAWAKQGDVYLATAARAVADANQADLAVVLAGRDAGALPSATMPVFWRAWAEHFKDNPRVVFDLFDKPIADGISGRIPGRRSANEWSVWRDGGATSNGTVTGMQQLVEAIRATGATQVVAAQSYSDVLAFQGFDAGYWLRDTNVIYEVHAYFDRALTAGERETNFGFLTSRLPIYAGE